MRNSADRERSLRLKCRALTAALNQIRIYETDISVASFMILLTIGAKPGLQMKEIERAVGLSSSAIHRNLRMLSDKHWRKDETGKLLPGHDLVVVVPDAFDPRSKVVALTPRGRKVLELVMADLNNGKEPDDG